MNTLQQAKIFKRHSSPPIAALPMVKRLLERVQRLISFRDSVADSTWTAITLSIHRRGANPPTSVFCLPILPAPFLSTPPKPRPAPFSSHYKPRLLPAFESTSRARAVTSTHCLEYRSSQPRPRTHSSYQCLLFEYKYLDSVGAARCDSLHYCR